MWDLRQHSERNTVYNLDVHEQMYLNLNTVWMYCFICSYLNPDSNIQGWATCCCFVAVDVVCFRVCVHLHVWFIRHVVAACHNTFTSEDHPLSMVSLSFTLFMCRLFSSIWAHFIEKTEGALCFSAGSSDFGIICLEAQIKCEFSIVFSITSSNNLLHAGFVFFFYVQSSPGELLLLCCLNLFGVCDALCSVYTDFITSPCKPCLEKVFWCRKLIYKV